MASQVKPGQWVRVKIKSEPKSLGGKKTLVRVCEKDEGVTAERKRLAKARPAKFHTRGGRPWRDQPARLQVVKMDAGATYKVFGSVDVLRDLASVKDYVEVSPA